MVGNTVTNCLAISMDMGDISKIEANEISSQK